MSERTLAEADPELRRRLTCWLEEYINQPHPDLGREGPVCPFVEPAQKNETLELMSAGWTSPGTVDDVIDIIDIAMKTFGAMQWKSSNTSLQTLVVAVPDMLPSEYPLIDQAHLQKKGDIVDAGMMIGQFHPWCAAPAAHNDAFPVNRSPVPLYALRNVAFHDILFLHSQDEWFEQYSQRFHRQYGTSPGKLPPKFLELYREATRRAESGGCGAAGQPGEGTEET